MWEFQGFGTPRQLPDKGAHLAKSMGSGTGGTPRLGGFETAMYSGVPDSRQQLLALPGPSLEVPPVPDPLSPSHAFR